MKSKTKRLLSVTLAIAMIILSAFSALADDAVTTVQYISGTVTASNVSANAGDTEVTVPVTITFENKQTSPHGMFDISAEGATLKSATLVSFNNDNYVKDPNLSDEENIDKSVYLDADGINSANGRIIVESSTDESKKPATSEVKIDVVLKFATALKADQVIDVVIDGIQATNFSEASWDGMKAVNGKITVTAAEPDYGTLTNGSADLLYKNNMDLPVQYQNTVYSGDIADIEEYGIIVIREDKYDGGALTTETPGAMSQTWDTLQTNSNLSVYGFAFKNITKEYIFVNYVKVNGKYIYADSVRTSYATLCANRIPTGGTGGEKATLYLDTYYTLFGEKLYDGAKELGAADTTYGYAATYTKNEHTFPAMGTDLTYTIANTNGYLLFNNMEFGYGLTLSYNGDTSKVLETGVLMLREDKYTEGTQITKDTAGVLYASGEGFVEAAAYSVYGFSMSNIVKDYIFVPYVETADGVVYGEYLSRSFADTILARLDASGSNKAKAIFDVYAAANSTNSLYQQVEK